MGSRRARVTRWRPPCPLLRALSEIRTACLRPRTPAINLRTFIHRTTAASTTSNWSDLGHPLTLGDPDAIVVVDHNWNPNLTRGVYHDHTLGVWYNGISNDWAIFNQDESAMPEGVSFNVRIADPWTETALVHTATAGNTAGHVTTIDHPDLNDAPSRILVVTQNFNPGGGVGPRNNHSIAIGYSATEQRWKIRNQDGTSIPIGAIKSHPFAGVGSRSVGGVGFGTAVERDRALVPDDVLEGSIAVGHTAEARGVVLIGDSDHSEILRADNAATASRRFGLASAITH